MKYDTSTEEKRPVHEVSLSLLINLERINRVAVRNLSPLFQCPPIKLLKELLFYEFSNITIRGKILSEKPISMIYDLPEL